jgi:hypothetical protein
MICPGDRPFAYSFPQLFPIENRMSEFPMTMPTNPPSCLTPISGVSTGCWFCPCVWRVQPHQPASNLHASARTQDFLSPTLLHFCFPAIQLVHDLHMRAYAFVIGTHGSLFSALSLFQTCCGCRPSAAGPGVNVGRQAGNLVQGSKPTGNAPMSVQCVI